MTIKELAEELKKHPDDMKVRVQVWGHENTQHKFSSWVKMKTHNFTVTKDPLNEEFVIGFNDTDNEFPSETFCKH